VIALLGNRFAIPAGLVELIQHRAGTPLLRSDQKIVYLCDWEDKKTRLAGVAKLLQALVKIVGAEKPDVNAALPPPQPSLVKPQAARRWYETSGRSRFAG
jgi:hypothetical protein